ncbi:MAG: cupin-like domain-containing protein [Polyangiales bacterium]
MRVVSIERQSAPSAETFRTRYERPRRPVVITGAIDHWPALHRWSLARIAAEYGERSVIVRIADHPSQRFAGDEQRTFRRAPMKVSDFAEALARSPEAGAMYYLQAREIAHDFPSLAGDLARPPYPPRWNVSPALLFVNGPGAIAPPHYDYNHVLMAGVTGEKRYLLMAPEDSPKVSDFVTRHLWRTTPIDLAHPDAFTLAALRDVTLHEHVLRPGEMLFIPYRWWHHMDAPSSAGTESISVSWWWQPSTFHRVRDEAFYRVLHPLRLYARR